MLVTPLILQYYNPPPYEQGYGYDEDTTATATEASDINRDKEEARGAC